MPDTFPEKPAPEGLAATFAHRVAMRDVLVPPPPPSQDPDAIAGRVANWLLTQHHLRDVRSRMAIQRALLLLLAQPEASTAALQAATGLGPRMMARTMLRLQALGLTEWFTRVHTRYHRLTRTGEDALLPVVTGEAPVAARLP